MLTNRQHTRKGIPDTYLCSGELGFKETAGPCRPEDTLSTLRCEVAGSAASERLRFRGISAGSVGGEEAAEEGLVKCW